MSGARARRGWLRRGLLVLLVALLAEALWRGGVLEPLERRLQDYWFQSLGQRGEARHVAIVAIDEESLAAYPDDPLVFWTDRLAEAVERLRAAGAKVVGLDLLLSISPERWLGQHGGELQQAARNYDRAFREQLSSGQLLLVASRSGSGAQESDYLLPSPDYLLALPEFDIRGFVGLADLLEEGDGIVRRYRLAPVEPATRSALPDELPQLGLPALLAIRATGQDPRAFGWRLGGHALSAAQVPTPIPYLGPPGSFPRLSLHRLLAPDSAHDPALAALRGKVVLIGATAAGLGDEHFTPYASRPFGGRSLLMSGVEVHANIIEALLAGTRLLPLADEWRLVGLMLLAGLAVAAFAVLPAWLSGLLWLGGVLLLVLAGLLAFRFGLLLPVSVYAVATGLALLAMLGWRLSGEERERARLRQLFGRYVSDRVVESLLQSDTRPELGGQSQTVTVLFSDIRNFTTLSERLDAKEVVEMLNTYFQRACEPLLAEGGSIDKFIGDAVMVEFGSPLPLVDHAQRGLRAALALQAVAAEFADWMRQRFPGRDLPTFAIGIGLHSGEAVIGNIGSSIRMEFTAIGDTVNLASRLESMTKQLGCPILASEATIAAAGGAVRCGHEQVIRVKGRDAPIRVFEVLGSTGGSSDG